MKIFNKKKCKDCGDEFIPTGPQSKYCSTECYKVNYNKRCLDRYYKLYQDKKKIERKKNLFTKQCNICTQEFQTYKKNRLFCSKRCYNKDVLRKSKFDPICVIKRKNRDRIYGLVKSYRMIKTKSSIIYLGVAAKIVAEYIESQFKPGMSWENYGEWEIDHIRPLSSFDLLRESECMIAFNYKNLQPLWLRENRSKSSLYNGKYQHIKNHPTTCRLTDTQ